MPCNLLTLLLCLCFAPFLYSGLLFLFMGFPIFWVFLPTCHLPDCFFGPNPPIICLCFPFLNLLLPLSPNLTFILVAPPSPIFGFGRSQEAWLDARRAQLLLTQGHFILSDKYAICSLEGYS